MTKQTHRNDELKKNLTLRLKRIEGQIRGIQRMLDEDQYCDDILTQIAASRSALSGVSKLILENHLKSCLVRDIKNDHPEVLDGLLLTIEKMMKK